MTMDIVHDVDEVVVKAEMISLIGLKKRNIIKIIIMIIIIKKILLTIIIKRSIKLLIIIQI